MGVNFDFLNSRVNIDILRFLADNSGKSGNENDVNLVKAHNFRDGVQPQGDT